MASCHYCRQAFTRVEILKMVTAHIQPDGSLEYTIPVENKKATGAIVWCAHYKEFKQHDKREKRGGNASTGSSLGEVTPNAFNIDDMDTSEITERQQLKRTIARELGIDSENWRVAEVMRRRDHGDLPYVHTHERRMEPWKIAYHLEVAHGALSGADFTAYHAELVHQAAHVSMAKANDPGYADQATTDWHDSVELDL